MSPFYEMTWELRTLVSVGFLSVLLIALWNLVTVCSMRLNVRYFLTAVFLTAGILFVLQGTGDISVQMNSGREFTFFAAVVGRIPAWMVLPVLLLSALSCLFFRAVLKKKESSMLTPDAIRESLNTLPDGVCYFDTDGQPLLVNTQMNLLCGELFDTQILNAEHFWDSLREGTFQSGAERISTEGQLAIKTGSGRVWNFRRGKPENGSAGVQEIIAYDVTEEYRYIRELAKRNTILNQVNARLRRYSREVERVVADRELLTAKVKVHDDVGRALLAFRSGYLSRQGEERDRRKLLLLWRSTIAVLENEASFERRSSDFELLLQAAAAVGVEMVQDGELPESGRERAVLMMALHECLTNTVKHAGGNQLYFCIRRKDAYLRAEITNNGRTPQTKIQETGGLRNLRRAVEAEGGTMSIESSPRFVLRIELVRGVEDDG